MNDELDFTRIQEQVASFAITPAGKNKLLNCKVSANFAKTTQLLEETEQAKDLLDTGQHMPFVGSEDLEGLRKKGGQRSSVRKVQG